MTTHNPNPDDSLRLPGWDAMPRDTPPGLHDIIIVNIAIPGIYMLPLLDAGSPSVESIFSIVYHQWEPVTRSLSWQFDKLGLRELRTRSVLVTRSPPPLGDLGRTTHQCCHACSTLRRRLRVIARILESTFCSVRE